MALIPGTAFSGTTLNLYFPKAKIGRGNYIYAWSGGRGIGSGGSPLDGINYYTLAQIVQIYNPGGGFTIANPGLTVLEAYIIDKKVDDGMPQSGNVSALYLGNPSGDGEAWWAAGGGNDGACTPYPDHGPTTAATPASTTTCYDNGNV